VVLLLALQILAAVPSWVGYTPEQLTPEITAAQSEPVFTKRFLSISEHFVGAPYLFSPLGEATGADNDPLFTTKQFDCLSLVEISLALSSTANMDEALTRLKQLRYMGETVHYTERKHFMESQWVPENIRLGWIEDITQKVGGASTIKVSKTLNPAIYKKRSKLKELDLPDDKIPSGTFTWDVIPLDKIMDVARKIPNGTILFVVRVDYQNIPYRISHTGIVFQRGKTTYLRHAKDSGAHMVVDMPLEAVVNRHAEFVKWPVTGFSLYLPQQPPAKKVASTQ
jgi:hypothetical protein